MNQTIAGIFALALLAGCASQPEDVVSTYVTPSKYDSHDCKKLETQYDEIDANWTRLWETQKKKADSDVVWFVAGGLIGLGINSAINEDVEDELAEVKGEREAVVQAALDKDCSAVIRKAADKTK